MRATLLVLDAVHPATAQFVKNDMVVLPDAIYANPDAVPNAPLSVYSIGELQSKLVKVFAALGRVAVMVVASDVPVFGLRIITVIVVPFAVNLETTPVGGVEKPVHVTV